MGGLGELVRMTREARGISQGELARAIEMAPSGISRLEAGRVGRGVPIATIARIAQALRWSDAQCALAVRASL